MPDMYFMLLEHFQIICCTYLTMQIMIPMNLQHVPGIGFSEFAVCSLKPDVYIGNLYQWQRVCLRRADTYTGSRA